MTFATLFAVIGTLCLFGGGMAFAVGSITWNVSLDWQPDRKPSKLNRVVGYLFGLRNYEDILRVWSGGSYEELRKKGDYNAPARGVVWTFIGTMFVIVSLLV